MVWSVLGGCLLVGCVGHRAMFVVQVDAKLEYKPDPPALKYVLLPAEMGQEQNDDSQFRVVAGYVERALQRAGYESAGCAYGERHCKAAELAIFVEFEQVGTRQPYVFYEPACAAPLYTWDPNLYGRGQGGSRRVGPMCRPIGYFEYQGGYVEYHTRLTLSALDLVRERAAESPRRPWRTEMVVEGFIHELDRLVPALLAAGGAYFGSDSGANLKVRIHEQDERVCRIAQRACDSDE